MIQQSLIQPLHLHETPVPLRPQPLPDRRPGHHPPQLGHHRLARPDHVQGLGARLGLEAPEPGVDGHRADGLQRVEVERVEEVAGEDVSFGVLLQVNELDEVFSFSFSVLYFLSYDTNLWHRHGLSAGINTKV